MPPEQTLQLFTVIFGDQARVFAAIGRRLLTLLPAYCCPSHMHMHNSKSHFPLKLCVPWFKLSLTLIHIDNKFWQLSFLHAITIFWLNVSHLLALILDFVAVSFGDKHFFSKNECQTPQHNLLLLCTLDLRLWKKYNCQLNYFNC